MSEKYYLNICTFVVNMKRPPNLNEEIAAMAKSDSASISMISMDNVRIRDEEKQISAVAKPNSNDLKRKRKENRSQLVREIRISVSIPKIVLHFRKNVF